MAIENNFLINHKGDFLLKEKYELEGMHKDKEPLIGHLKINTSYLNEDDTLKEI